MKRLLSLIAVLLLSSCASMHYGNFSHVDENKDKALANDAVNRVAKAYIPARTTFRFNQKLRDGFGAELAQKLRQQGYGVIEKSTHQSPANFRYVVDESNQKQVVRVSLFIENQVYSRAYLLKDEVLAPVSIWSHKEA